MTKYRFKTEKEFKEDDQWDKYYNTPDGWNNDGDMNKYLGTDIPDNLAITIDKNYNFIFDGWNFRNSNVIENKKTKSSNVSSTNSLYHLLRKHKK